MDNLPDITDVVSSCCGLITIDEQSSIIRLVHYTTQEYFERSSRDYFPDAESHLAKICVTYLSFSVFGSGACANIRAYNERVSSYALYEYAAEYWGRHAYLATNHEFCSTFLVMAGQVNASAQVLVAKLNHMKYWRDWGYIYPCDVMTGLHLAAFFGLREEFGKLLQHHNKDVPDCLGITPIIHAINNRHINILKLLLEMGVMVNSTVNSHTLLSHAAMAGHEDIVRLLLKKGADINIHTQRTLLYFAAGGRHDAVVQLFLEHGVYPDLRGEIGAALVRTIIGKSRIGAVLPLLKQGFLADLEAFWRARPISFAVLHGGEAVVRLLLEHGDHIESKGLHGWTPIFYAVENNRIDMLRLLLDAGADMNIKDKDGKTPLSHALGKKDLADIAQLLRERGACEPEDSSATKVGSSSD